MRANIKDKDYAISVVRLFALLLVIWCHTFEYLGVCYEKHNFWLTPLGNYSSVGVQIFLLISGYLYGKKDTPPRIPFVKKNFGKILKDYYVHYILFTIPLCLLFDKSALSVKALWGMVTCWCTFGGEVQLWFIPYILFCYLITPMLYDIRVWISNGRNAMLKFLFLIIAIELLFIEYDFYFAPAWICCYVIGYFFPFIAEKYKCLFNRFTYIIMLVGCVVTNVIKYYYRYIRGYSAAVVNNLIWEGNVKAQVLNEYFNWSAVLLAITLLITIYCGVGLILRDRKLRGNLKIKWLDIADKFSYDIYICHMMFVKGMLSTIMITPYVFLNLAITGVLIIVSSIVLYYVCRPREIRTLVRHI